LLHELTSTSKSGLLSTLGLLESGTHVGLESLELVLELLDTSQETRTLLGPIGEILVVLVVALLELEHKVLLALALLSELGSEVVLLLGGGLLGGLELADGVGQELEQIVLGLLGLLLQADGFVELRLGVVELGLERLLLRGFARQLLEQLRLLLVGAGTCLLELQHRLLERGAQVVLETDGAVELELERADLIGGLGEHVAQLELRLGQLVLEIQLERQFLLELCEQILLLGLGLAELVDQRLLLVRDARQQLLELANLGSRRILLQCQRIHVELQIAELGRKRLKVELGLIQISLQSIALAHGISK
jgi:hypothetical protein